MNCIITFLSANAFGVYVAIDTTYYPYAMVPPSASALASYHCLLLLGPLLWFLKNCTAGPSLGNRDQQQPQQINTEHQYYKGHDYNSIAIYQYQLVFIYLARP